MEHLLKISDFSRLSGIPRKNLIYYHEIGLLPPERVMENGYRLYAHRQLETVSVISALQEVGMPLCEIKRHLDARTPASLLALFSAQRESVEKRIQKLQRIEAMIDTRLGITRSALELDPAKIELRACAEELLFAGDEICCQDRPEELEKAVETFYNLCDAEKITYGYPFGTMIARENLEQENWHFPARYFFKMPLEEGSRPKLSKPAGLYLTGFERGAEAAAQRLYTRLYRHMKQRGLVIKGNSYEEFLLDEIAVKTPEDYLLRISIQVDQRGI